MSKRICSGPLDPHPNHGRWQQNATVNRLWLYCDDKKRTLSTSPNSAFTIPTYIARGYVSKQ